jgi:hypothetical protein
MKHYQSYDLECRVRSLERRLNALSKGHKTLYHAAYAKLVRRGKTSSKVVRTARRVARLWEGATDKSLIRMGKIVGALNRGKMLMMLNSQQRYRLAYLLRPKGKGTKAIIGSAGARAVFLQESKMVKLRKLLAAKV